MENFGFNPDLVGNIRKLNATATSRHYIIGTLSESIPMNSSVRQEDPLAMYLFAIYFSPLLNKLQMICNSRDNLLNAYAYDISIITTSEDQILQIKNEFNTFSIVSGIKLNPNKSQALDIGISNNTRIKIPWLHTTDKIKLLGIIFTNSMRSTMKLNWDQHKNRDLTLNQKAILCNTFITSKLWFVGSIISVSSFHLGKILNLLNIFMGPKKNLRFSLNQLTLPKAQGGLNLLNPRLKMKTLLINRHWIGRDFMPYTKTFIENTGNPPYLLNIPSTYPCIKQIANEIAYISLSYKQEPSAKKIYRIAHKQLPLPSIVIKEPNFQSIKNNKEELNHILRNEEFHIACLQESWLKPD
uniref:Reverse transcriptase domain-containing protein n=1 Tax=Anopheles funestus TaxID=62324 RepID=A0A182RPQ2_ANOFN